MADTDTTAMHVSIALIAGILGANIFRTWNIDKSKNLSEQDDNRYLSKYIIYVLILAVAIMMGYGYYEQFNVVVGIVVGVLTAVLFYYGVVAPTSNTFF